MGVRDAQRLGSVKAAIEGRITNAKGAELTGLSLRQFRRLKARVRRAGPAGLQHGNQGRPSPRRLGGTAREQIATLLQHPESRLNDCHLRDVQAERGIEVSAETVRQVRHSLGLKAKRRRRPAQHRRRRLRAGRIGSLVLIDGSEYAWMGDRVPPFTLVGTLDDATGDPLSLVRRPHEDLHGFTQALRDLIVAFGLPETLYGDQTGIAVRNDRHWTLDEQLAGRQDPTQFGQILAELGIHYIPARSPEAKGRIEHLWQTLQDRLPAEVALRGIDTLEAFDAFLPEFLRLYRKWFARDPREAVPAWRPAPRQLDRVLACRYSRVVSRDNIVSIPGHTLQLPLGSYRRSFAHTRVEVRELLDSRLLVLHEGRVLLEQPPPQGGFTLVPRRSSRGIRRPPRETSAPQSTRIDERPAPRPAPQAPLAIEPCSNVPAAAPFLASGIGSTTKRSPFWRQGGALDPGLLRPGAVDPQGGRGADGHARGAVSPATVSEVAKLLDREVEVFHRRRFTGPYRVLILDGVVLSRRTGAGALHGASSRAGRARGVERGHDAGGHAE